MLFHPIFEVGLIFSHFKKKLVNLVIAVDPELSTIDSHNIATNVEAHIERKHGVYDISIHVEPMNKKR